MLLVRQERAWLKLQWWRLLLGSASRRRLSWWLFPKLDLHFGVLHWCFTKLHPWFEGSVMVVGFLWSSLLWRHGLTWTRCCSMCAREEETLATWLACAKMMVLVLHYERGRRRCCVILLLLRRRGCDSQVPLL